MKTNVSVLSGQDQAFTNVLHGYYQQLGCDDESE